MLLVLCLPVCSLAAPGDRSGSEFGVNTVTFDDQNQPSIAADASGNFVVSWTSVAQDGNLDGVFARRYAADGTAQAAPFQVNSVTLNDQQSSAVAMDADGDFVIVWQGDEQPGCNQQCIFGRRYAADGSTAGDEFQVNTTQLDNQEAPAIAIAADGRFVVAWQSGSDASTGIAAQRYAANGTPAGSEFTVSTSGSIDESNPAVAMDALGNFLIAWQAKDTTGCNQNCIFAQRFSSDGTAQGSVFQVNTTEPNDQESPAVAMDAAGNFVVAWQSNEQTGCNQRCIFAQRFAADGTAAGSEFQVNTTEPNDQLAPAITMDPEGRFVVTWESRFQDGSLGGIFARRYAANGTTLNAEFQVNTQTFDEQTSPAVASNDGLAFVVAWTSELQDGSFGGIFAQRFEGDPLPLVSSVLPSSRSVRVGSPATVFATIINSGSQNATGCNIRPLTTVAANFLYQTTNPTTNVLTGTPNTATSINAGAGATFLLSLTPTAAVNPLDVLFAFDCANTGIAPLTLGVNSLLFSAAITPVPDIVAIAATTGDPGIVDVSTTADGAFAIASTNVGVSATLSVSADTGSATLPLTLRLCRTNPANGACVQPATPTAGPLSVTIGNNETSTFSVFLSAAGAVAFSPATNRVFVRFQNGGVVRGATSVAVRTIP